MNSDMVLSILIEFGLKEDAAKQAVARLEEIKDKSEDMNTHVPEGAEAWKKYKNILNQTSEEAGHLHANHRLLHFAMKEMGAELPGLGILLRGLFNPVTIGVIGGSAALEAYFKHLEKIQEKYHELISSAQKVNDAWREMNKTSKSADEKFIETSRAMAAVQESGRGLSADLHQVEKSFGSMEKAADSAAERLSQLHKDIAEMQTDAVDLMEAIGQVSSGEAEQMKLRIQHAEKLKQLADERKKIDDEVKLAQSEGGQAQRVYQRALGEAGGSEQSAFINKQAADDKVARLESVISHYADIQKKISDAEKQADEAKRKGTSLAPEAYQMIQDLERQRDALKNEYEKAKSELPAAERAKIQFDTLWADLAKAKETLQQINDKITEALAKQRDLATAQAEGVRSENANYGLKSVTAMVKDEGGLSPVIQDVAHTFDLASHGQKITEAQRQQYAAVQEFLQGIGISTERMVKMLEDIVKFPEHLDSRLSAVEAAVAAQARQIDRVGR